MHTHDETADQDQLLLELQQLRRGHGLLSRDLDSRIGPRLSAVAGLNPTHSAGQRRQQLISFISQQLDRLPEDLRLAVSAAYALAPASQSRFLRERMEWLGHQLDRDARTAQRRVEVGLTMLVEPLALASGPFSLPEPMHALDGWYVDSFQATLMMHKDPTQLLETRRIVSTRSDLDHVTVSWSVPADTDSSGSGVAVELLYGGDLERDDCASTRSYWAGKLKLPRPLQIGERHQFQVQISSLPIRLMRPFFVFSPFRRCDEFVLRAKFSRDHPPEDAWALDGVPFVYVDESHPVGELVKPDAFGEISRSFRNLRQGLSYGLRWRYGSDGHNADARPGFGGQSHN